MSLEVLLRRRLHVHNGNTALSRCYWDTSFISVRDLLGVAQDSWGSRRTKLLLKKSNGQSGKRLAAR